MSVTLGGSSKLVWTGTNPISTYPISLFCWVKFASTSALQSVMGYGDNGNTGSNGTMEVMAYGGIDQKVYGRVKVGGGGVGPASLDSMSTSWQPCLVVYETSSNRYTYYGANASAGSEVSVASSPILSGFTKITLGERPDQDALYYLNGDIAEFAIWSADMRTHWSTLQGDNKPELVNSGTGLVEHWKLETSGDYTGTVSRTLTATGTVTTGATHPITRGGGSSTGALRRQLLLGVG